VRKGLIATLTLVLTIMIVMLLDDVLMFATLLLLLLGAASVLIPSAGQAVRHFAWSKLKACSRPLGDRTVFGFYRPHHPVSGPRKWIHQLTGKRWNFGPHYADRRKLDTHTITHRCDEDPITVGVYSEGGGVGKTVNAATFAQQVQMTLEGVSILLVDKDPKGTVRDVTGVKREHIQAHKDGRPDEACFTLIDAARNMNKLTNMAQVRWRFATMPGTGLFVLTYPEGERLDKTTLKNLMKRLSTIFPIVVYDCEPDADHLDTSFILENVDVHVVPTLAGDRKRTRQAADAIKTLRDEKYRRDHDRVVFVVNKVWNNLFHRGTTRNVEVLQELLGEAGKPYLGPVATVPWNRLIKKGKVFHVRTRSPWFRRHALEQTAIVYKTARSTKGPASSSKELTQTEPTSRQPPATTDA
jgi:cellulose biosynthesis protein BcsQ